MGRGVQSRGHRLLLISYILRELAQAVLCIHVTRNSTVQQRGLLHRPDGLDGPLHGLVGSHAEGVGPLAGTRPGDHHEVLAELRPVSPVGEDLHGHEVRDSLVVAKDSEPSLLRLGVPEALADSLVEEQPLGEVDDGVELVRPGHLRLREHQVGGREDRALEVRLRLPARRLRVDGAGANVSVAPVRLEDLPAVLEVGDLRVAAQHHLEELPNLHTPGVAVEEEATQLVLGGQLGVQEVREDELRAVVEDAEDVGELPGVDDGVVRPRLRDPRVAGQPRVVASLHEVEEVHAGVEEVGHRYITFIHMPGA